MFAVTKSALDVLQERQSYRLYRRIWIDAICINQEDNEEKSIQVQMMREIYANADRVVLLPSGNPGLRIAVPLFFQSSERCPDPHDSVLDLRPLSFGTAQTPRWRAMAELLASEYFQRCWIIQEIAVGKDVQMCVGGLYVPWDDVTRSIGYLRPAHRHAALNLAIAPADVTSWATQPPPIEFLTGINSTFTNIQTIISLRKDNEDAYGYAAPLADRLKLSAILLHTTGFRASDPRDLIFAKIGLANNTLGKCLPDASYAKTREHVFEEAARFLFVQSHDACLDLLTYAGIGYGQTSSNLPSWVPRFDAQAHSASYTASFAPMWDDARAIFASQKGAFRASRRSKCDVEEDSLPPNVLRVSGMVVDYVLDLSAENAWYSGDHPFFNRASDVPELLQHSRDRARSVMAARHLLSKYATAFPHLASARKREIHLARALVAHPDDAQLDLAEADDQYLAGLLAIQLLVALAEMQFGNPVDNALEQQARQADKMFAGAYLAALTDACHGRRFAISAMGHLSLVPPLTQIGDTVFVPDGAQVPYICRKRLDVVDGWDLVGEAYVHNLMMGRTIEKGEGKRVVLQIH